MPDYANVGPGLAQFVDPRGDPLPDENGKPAYRKKWYKLQEPSPEGFSMMAAYIVQNVKPATAVDRILEVIDKLPPTLADAALARAQEMDNVAATREMYSKPRLDGSAIFEPGACALWLHTMVLPHHLDMTIEECRWIVDKETPMVVLAKIWTALPGLKAKNDPAPLESSTGGETATEKAGQESVAS